MARVCATPDFYSRIDSSDIHKAGLKRFPFHVIYRAEPAPILILAIVQHRRRPTYWVGRAGK